MSVALIISIVVFLAIVYSGYRNGLFSSAATLFMLALAMVIAAEFYGPIAATPLCRNMGDYAESVCMFLLFVVGYFMLQVTANLFTPPTVHMRRSVNKLGGIGLSVVNATILSGFLGLVFCMMPWTGVQGGHLAGESFIGTPLIADGMARLVRGVGGNAVDPAALFTRLKTAEEDRVCYRNLDDILDRLSDLYRDWESSERLTTDILKDAIENGTRLPVDGLSGGKGVGAAEMKCPCDGRDYIIIPVGIGALATVKEKENIQVYDAEYSHVVNGKPARMVLSTWRGRDASGRVRVQGTIELMPEDQFPQELKDAK